MICAAIFGSLGGGGKSGNLICGKEGSVGKSGKSGSGGNSGIVGNFNEALGELGREKSGKFGSLIGDNLKLNSGTVTFIHNLISDKSRTKSGQVGKLIIGISGIIIDINLNFQY